MDLTGRINLVRSLKKSSSKDIPIQTAANLLDVNISTVYYKGSIYYKSNTNYKSNMNYKHKKTFERKLFELELLDRLHTENPSWGVRKLSKHLCNEGHKMGLYKAEQCMRVLGIHSQMSSNKHQYSFPFLLNNVTPSKPNEVWSISTTFIRLGRGYAFLTAILDWYSLYLVGWDIDFTINTDSVLKALNNAFHFGLPEILNSDQGVQFSNSTYAEFILSKNITISMNHKNFLNENIMNQWFRILKYNEIYLNCYEDINECKNGISNFICMYNNELPNEFNSFKIPASEYISSCP